jgi:4-alpha-glucanotransferase
MEPFAALYDGGDLADYGAKLKRALGRPVGSTRPDLLAASTERLAASAAYLVVADLDDLLGEITPHNIPGKVLPTIWRRRLRRPTSETLADPEVRRLLRILTERRR